MYFHLQLSQNPIQACLLSKFINHLCLFISEAEFHNFLFTLQDVEVNSFSENKPVYFFWFFSLINHLLKILVGELLLMKHLLHLVTIRHLFKALTSPIGKL